MNQPKKQKSKIKKLLTSVGPGFITGASDDDPSGIATYSQTGAIFGYTQLWVIFFTIPFMSAIQEICGRIGIVTGKGLSKIIKENYSKTVLYFSVSLLLVANTINIGADLGAMAAALKLLFKGEFWFWLILSTIVILILEIFLSYKVYSRFLKFFASVLLVYIIAALFIKQDWVQIAQNTVLPSISFKKDYILNIVALLGTTISPYLFFWQTSEEVEEKIDENNLKYNKNGLLRVEKKDVMRMRFDTITGMIFSNIISFFIIITAASTLHINGITQIETASQAAQALKPIAGDYTFFLFALGIIGTGLLAIPVLSGSASYAISEMFDWNSGLYNKLNQAHGFYGVITVATLIGLLINFTSIKPFQLLYYTAIFNGLVAAPLLIIIMKIGSSKKIMGVHTNNRTSSILGWITTLIIGFAGILLIVDLLVA